LGALERSINVLNNPVHHEGSIRNAGFESVGGGIVRGRLEGWTTSLDSHATISIDPTSAATGTSSLKIDSRKDSSSAWIQSDSFVLAEPNRLLVGLKVATAKVPNQAMLSLSRLASDRDRYELVATRDLNSPWKSGIQGANWIALQFDFSQELSTLDDRSEPQVFRLQIETKGPTQFWIDDLFVSTEFLTADERLDMRSELFLAKTSLQNGDTQPANNILGSTRVRFIPLASFDSAHRRVQDHQVSITKPLEANAKAVPATPTHSPNPVVEPSKPTFGRRIRNLWGQRSDNEK